MTRKHSLKFVAGAIGVALAGSVAVAAAAGSPPDAADDGLSTAEEHTGFSVPVSPDDDPGGDATDLTTATEGIGPVDNHGAEVSAVANDDSTTGREHGEAVAEEARAGHGATTASEASEGASDQGADHAADQAALGAANAEGHGQP